MHKKLCWIHTLQVASRAWARLVSEDPKYGCDAECCGQPCVRSKFGHVFHQCPEHYRWWRMHGEWRIHYNVFAEFAHCISCLEVLHSDTTYQTGLPDVQMQPCPSLRHIGPGDAATATRLAAAMTCRYDQMPRLQLVMRVTNLCNRGHGGPGTSYTRCRDEPAPLHQHLQVLRQLMLPT